MKQVKALKLRRQGKTFKEISLTLGINASYARELVEKAIRLEQDSVSWHYGLSKAAAAALVNAGYASKEAVQQDVLSGKIHYPVNSMTGTGIPRLGKLGFADICKWLGVKKNDVLTLQRPEMQALQLYEEGASLKKIIPVIANGLINQKTVIRTLHFIGNLSDEDVLRLRDAAAKLK